MGSDQSGGILSPFTGTACYSGNGLLPVRCQAITWTNAGLLSIGLLATNLNEIRVGIQSFSFKEMWLKMSSAKMAAILSRGRWANRVAGGCPWHHDACSRLPDKISIIQPWYCPMDLLWWPGDKQRVLMHGHQGWNVRHGLCHIYKIYVYIWVVYSFCLFCCLFIIVTTQFVALYKPCKPKPKFR